MIAVLIELNPDKYFFLLSLDSLISIELDYKDVLLKMETSDRKLIILRNRYL